MSKLPALSADDILALQTLKAWVDDPPPEHDAGYLAALREREAALGAKALAVWQSWPADRLAVELARWRPTFLVEKTAAGFRAFRWIQVRMTAAQVADYQHSLIRT